jgi:hypothetical protein
VDGVVIVPETPQNVDSPNRDVSGASIMGGVMNSWWLLQKCPL